MTEPFSPSAVAGTVFAVLPHASAQRVCIVRGSAQHSGDSAAGSLVDSVIAEQSLVFARTEAVAAAAAAAVPSPQMLSPSIDAEPDASIQRREQAAEQASLPSHMTAPIEASAAAAEAVRDKVQC